MPQLALILIGSACLLAVLGFVAVGALATWATSDRPGKPDAGTDNQEQS